MMICTNLSYLGSYIGSYFLKKKYIVAKSILKWDSAHSCSLCNKAPTKEDAECWLILFAKVYKIVFLKKIDFRK